MSAGSPPLHSHRGHTQSSPDECECERKKAEESNGWMWLVRAKGGEWSIHTTTQCVVSQHSNSSRGLHTPLLGTGCGRCRGVEARHASTPRVVHTVACTHRVIVVVMAPGCLPRLSAPWAPPSCCCPYLCAVTEKEERRGEAVRPRRHDRRGVGGGGWMLAAASATSSTVQHGGDREEKQTHIRSV